MEKDEQIQDKSENGDTCSKSLENGNIDLDDEKNEYLNCRL